jgi:deazaflavin-dependent oxidoreductase (nitroreductase family)
VTGTDAYDRQIIDEFRAGHGVLGGAFQGQQLLLLHHFGAKSGAERITPLIYWTLSNTSVAVLASNYGAPSHPAWYHNLLAQPDATVEIGSATVGVHARVATVGERRRLLDHMTATNPGVAAAVARTARQIPVVILDIVEPHDPSSRRRATLQPRGTHRERIVYAPGSDLRGRAQQQPWLRGLPPQRRPVGAPRLVHVLRSTTGRMPHCDPQGDNAERQLCALPLVSDASFDER